MQPLPSIKRDLILVLSLSALVFVCALAWGHPFIGSGNSAAPVQAQQGQTQQSQAQAATFTGTVRRNGEQFFLQESSGQVYRLDDPQHAQTYEGKAVKVTGKLDAEARMIHVERIEEA